jgi:hypothetical protein
MHPLMLGDSRAPFMNTNNSLILVTAVTFVLCACERPKTQSLPQDTQKVQQLEAQIAELKARSEVAKPDPEPPRRQTAPLIGKWARPDGEMMQFFVDGTFVVTPPQPISGISSIGGSLKQIDDRTLKIELRGPFGGSVHVTSFSLWDDQLTVDKDLNDKGPFTYRRVQ